MVSMFVTHYKLKNIFCMQNNKTMSEKILYNHCNTDKMN